MSHRIAAALLALVLPLAATAAEPRRLDGTSIEAAESSWEAMVQGADPATQQKLLEAMLMINFAGVQSAKDVVADPALQRVGIARIRERVAGMTADEIIAYAAKVSTVRIEAGSP